MLAVHQFKTKGRKGSREFERLYAANRDAVLGYALRRVRVREDAAEILSETFLVAWRRFDELPGDDLARAWLLGVARNLLLNQRRGVQRSEALNTKLKSELSALPSVDAFGSPSHDPEVLTALARLSDSDQEVLTLSAWDELSPVEIAETLGLNRDTVRSQLHRARQRLKVELENSDTGPSELGRFETKERS